MIPRQRIPHSLQMATSTSLPEKAGLLYLVRPFSSCEGLCLRVLRCRGGKLVIERLSVKWAVGQGGELEAAEDRVALGARAGRSS